MKSSKKRAGSALLMIVGLLTILGMLGGTFLVVTSMHRRVSASLAATAPLHDMPIGILSQIVGKLRVDLHIAKFPDPSTEYAPYLGATAKPGVPMYADSGTTDSILGNTGAALYPGATQGAEVDTDGDGSPDAFLTATGVFNVDGNEIYVAVKIVDLSSLICVNTACGKTATVVGPVTPVKIGLLELVTASRYDPLHLARCGGESKTPAEFSQGSALVVSTAASPFEPYSVEADLFLRWQKPGAATNTGRLYNALTDFADRGLLTATARSRSLLRKPAFFETQIYRNRLLISALSSLDNDEKRNWLRTELYRVIGLVEDESQGQGESVIVDNAGAGASTTGDWPTTAFAPGYHDADYAYDGNELKGSKTFTFTPNITTPGNCEVYMWGMAAANYANNVPVDINHAGGTSTVTVDQTVNGGQWNLLGAYNFNEGTGGNITIRTDGTTSVVIADAIKVIMPDAGGPPATVNPPAPFVVDTDDGTPVGSWLYGAASAERYGVNYAHDQNEEKGARTFTFPATIPMPGQYEVYMWWPSNAAYASNIPVDIYHMDGMATVTVNQTVNGAQWNLLGAYNFAEGSGAKVVVRTDGTSFHVIADAVQFVCITVPQTADPKTVDHWVANLWAYLSQLDPKTNSFKVGDAYGIVPQLVITEAYAYSFKETNPGDGDEGWAYAIEMYNPTSNTVNASNYTLKCGTLSWDFSSGGISTIAPGSKVTLYAYGGMKFDNKTTAAVASDYFGLIGTWKQVAGDKMLDFAEANKDGVPIRIVRVVGGDEIPVDSVSGTEIGYSIIRDGAGAVGGSSATPDVSSARRDDDSSRGRALVAQMKIFALAESTKKSGHRLGLSNQLTAGNLASVFQGFFIRNKPSLLGEGDSESLGKLITRYITGPTIAEDGDLPHNLNAHMGTNNRGRINYNCPVPTWPAGYPELGWPQILGELLELVPPHTTASASRVIYGRININTAPTEVLEQLPFPTDAAFPTSEIIDAIVNGRPYHTPGAVAKILASYADGKLATKTASNYLTRRDSIYGAIANLITVNSDTFAVYIRTQIGDDPNAGASYHVGIIDRSNCADNDDNPKVLMYAEIKQ